MKTAHLLLPALTLLVTPVFEDSPAYTPEEDLTLTRRFESTSNYEMVDASIQVDGSPHEGAPEPDLSIEDTEVIVVNDIIAGAEDGRPTKLTRTFEELTNTQRMSAEAMDEDQEMTQISDLEGATVVFTWDEEEDAYAIEAGEDEVIDDDLLAGLEEDMDLRAFLPDGEVSEGDSWEVEVEAFLTFMWPGGSLNFYNSEIEEGPNENTARMNEAVVDALTGGGEVTFEGTREEDGIRVAVLALTLEMSSEGTIEVEGPGGETAENSVTMEREIEGEILWNLEAGLLHSASLSADATLGFGSAYTFEGPQGSMDVEQTQTFEGTITYAVTIELE